MATNIATNICLIYAYYSPENQIKHLYNRRYINYP